MSGELTASPPRSTGLAPGGLLAAERRVLEAVARGEPIGSVLDMLTHTIEQLAPGLYASVLLLDGEHLRHGSAPSLPEAYCQHIDGTAIGPCAGSCGTAAYRGDLVIVEDIAVDPRWEQWRAAALGHGLRACWSAPIFGATGQVLGTFALYYRDPRAPDSAHLDLIAAAAHVAGIAIERHQRDAERAAMIEDLNRAVRFNEMFVGVLSHDLRNPLSAILTGARLVQMNASRDVALRTAERILGSGARMSRMIEQLLDFTRIRMGQGLPVERRAVDLVELCRQAIDEVAGPERAPLSLEHAGDTTGYWDRDRLGQLISNLAGNAVQHGGAPASVRVRVDGSDAAQVTLSVFNAGEIPAPLLPVLFDPFRRSSLAAAPSRRGLGLGLFISQQVARAHGGDIQVNSAGGTTCFTLRLPRGQPAADPQAVSFAPARSGSGQRTVVVIDDDDDVRDLYGELFRGHGYRVLSHGGGAGALDVIRGAALPCVVVLDMSLPDLDGGQIYRAMQAEPALAAIPVVVSTADPHKSPSGVLMIRKPVDARVLLDTVRNLFTG